MQGVIVTTAHSNLKIVGRQAVDSLSQIFDDADDATPFLSGKPPPGDPALPDAGAAPPAAAAVEASSDGPAVTVSTNPAPDQGPSAATISVETTAASTMATAPVAEGVDIAAAAVGEDGERDDLSIEAELARELAELDGGQSNTRDGVSVKHRRPQPRFRFYDTGCRGVVFIACRRDVAPVPLVCALFQNAFETGERTCTLAARMLPATHICKAHLDNIVRSAQSLLDERFLKEGALAVSYNVQCRVRNTSLVNKLEVSDAVNALILGSAAGHTYALDDPEYVVVIEIMKNLCFMSVLPHWQRYAAYNIATVADPDGSRKRPADGESSAHTQPAKIAHVDLATSDDSTQQVFPSDYERELAAVRSRSLAARAARQKK